MTQNLPTLPAQHEFTMLQTIAKHAANSGLYGQVGGESKVFMVLMMARELGISPMIALNGGIWNIQGKVEISSRLMNSLIRRAGHSIKIKKLDKTECILVGKRTDGDEIESSFTMEDAIQAGLASRDVWKKYTEDMLYSRAMSRLARRLFSDVIGTAYVEGEISDKHIDPVTLPLMEVQEEIREKPQEEKISQEELESFLELIKIADNECISNMCAWLKKDQNIEEYSEMSKKAYNTCLRALNNNIEKRKNAQAVA